jgi:hypothetical protein
MAKQMVITFDVSTGNLVSVTDENGTPAEKYKPNLKQPLSLSGILNGGGATILHTQASPDCIWYEWDGTWYQICE